MADEVVYILATLEPKEGKKEEVLSGMKELAAEVEKGEEGCLSYAVFASPVDNTIIVFERYKNQQAVQDHKNSPHFLEAMKQGGESLSAPPKLQILTQQAGFNRP